MKNFISGLLSFTTNPSVAQSGMADEEVPYAQDDLFQAYTDSVNSLMVVAKKAFDKGWATTWNTAEYRAKLIKKSGDSVVDEYDNSTLWSGENFWNSWTAGEGEYKAGTFNYGDGKEYRNNYTGDVTTITVTTPQRQDPDTETLYKDLIVNIITLQNCAEIAPIGDSPNSNNIGLIIPYEDENATDGERSTTEYQLMRLAGEIAGRGIRKGDLNKSKESESIYSIETETKITPVVQRQDVEVKNTYYRTETKTGTRVVQQNWPKRDKNGNILHNSKGEIIYEVKLVEEEYEYEEQVPYEVWEHDHYDCYVTTTVSTVYSIRLKSECKDLISSQIVKDLTDEQKQAYYSSVDSFYGTQYQQVCEMFGLTPGGSWSGGIGSALTEEERAALLESLRSLTGLSPRQQKIVDICQQIATSANPTQTARSLGIAVDGGYCQRFVSDIYAKAGQPRLSFNSATEAAAKCTISSDRNPAVGATLYAKSSTSVYGHVGIYIGNGYVIDCISSNGSGVCEVMTFDAWIAQGYLTYTGWGANGWDLSQ